MTTTDYTTPSDTFVSSIDIHTLLPQQEPYVMVERMTHYDALRTVTTTVVKEDNTLVEDSHLTEAGLLENVAQTCAARIGYINRYILRRSITAGVVGAMRNMTIHRLPAVGEQMTTEINVKQEALNLLLVTATVKTPTDTLLNGEVVVVV